MELRTFGPSGAQRDGVPGAAAAAFFVAGALSRATESPRDFMLLALRAPAGTRFLS